MIHTKVFITAMHVTVTIVMLISGTITANTAPSTGIFSKLIVDGSGSDIPTEKLNKVLGLVANHMNDPYSSQFSEIELGKSSHDAICGKINSKNQFGGYVGFRFFFVDFTTGVVGIEPRRPDFSRQDLEGLETAKRDGEILKDFLIQAMKICLGNDQK